MGKWTDEQMLRFIQLYGYHQCLWDSSSSEYKSRDSRQHALKEIVAGMDIPGFGVSECKIKIKNIRSHYCQVEIEIAAIYRITTRTEIIWDNPVYDRNRSYYFSSTSLNLSVLIDNYLGLLQTTICNNSLFSLSFMII